MQLHFLERQKTLCLGKDRCYFQREREATIDGLQQYVQQRAHTPSAFSEGLIIIAKAPINMLRHASLIAFLSNLQQSLLHVTFALGKFDRAMGCCVHIQ